MELIQTWLNGGRNYKTGVRLYFQYGTDDELKSLFKQAETPFKRERLLEALSDLWDGYKKSRSRPPIPESEESTPEDQKHPPVPEQPSRWTGYTDDPVLASLKSNWNKTYSEMQLLRHRLLEIATKEERCAAAHRIMDLDNQCDEIYSKRDYYLQHGRLPDQVQPDIVGDPIKWPIKLQNAERYVREYKIRLSKDPGNIRFSAKLKHYQDEVAFYKKKLKLDE